MKALFTTSVTRCAAAGLAASLLTSCADRPGPLAPPPSAQLLGQDEDGGEIWVAAQDANVIAIVHGMGTVEMLAMPAGSGPHEVTFSPSGEYLYVGNMVNGTLGVVRADDRVLVASLALGANGTHQGEPSPDGSVVLVSQIPTRQLIKVAADESAESWTVGASLSLPLSPLCTSFRVDGQRAYVALRPSGIAVVDVTSMTLLATLPTAGVVRCGFAPSNDSRTIFAASNGGGGHIYTLDTETDVLTDLNALIGASEQQDVDVSPNEQRAYTTSFLTDEMKVIDLMAPGALAASVSLDATPGIVDGPDHVTLRGNTVYVTLGKTGKLAVVRANQGWVKYLDLVPPSATALHGIAVRPSGSP